MPLHTDSAAGSASSGERRRYMMDYRKNSYIQKELSGLKNTKYENRSKNGGRVHNPGG